MSASGETAGAPVAAAARGATSDGITTRGLIVIIALYLVVAVAAPLLAMFEQSLRTYAFQLQDVEVQFQLPDGTWGEAHTLAHWQERLGTPLNDGLRPSERTRLQVSKLISKADRKDVELFRLRDMSEDKGMLLFDGTISTDDAWREVERSSLGKVLVRPISHVTLDNYLFYFETPSLRGSILNSLIVSLITMFIVVPLAFGFAYAITRSCMPAKGLFKTVAMVPILVPSLLPGIGLVYLFGNQGPLNTLLMGESIYGPIGIVIASVFFTFPHAFLIILVALSISDARLYEASIALRATRWRTFWTVTVPGARYGLISSAFVVFTLVITDFGVPKVIGGGYNVLALDIYKQVIGQQNFQMGAVVSMILLVPALVAFAVDRRVRRRQVALLSARAVPYAPTRNLRFDTTMLAYCALVSFFIVGILAMCQLAALFKFWPYDLSFSLKNYDFDRMDGGGWDSYGNSLRMAFYVAVIGTVIVFVGAFVVEKTRVFAGGRWLLQLLAMMPMAVPGMVLGLSYIFFFNHPENPLGFLYGTMAILVICTIAHFYTVAHLTATTSLKQMDREFESVSASLKQSVWKVFGRVTMPVCQPAILDIAIYMFVNAMTTVSAVVFLYRPQTTLAAVAVLNMDDAGDIAPAAAMGMMIFYTNVAARLLHAGAGRILGRRSQAWRQRG
ncbi:MAG: putative 2-aminoethylphosphonate ABC transporter permease subunit [Pseudomonadota bacterium]